MTCTGHPAVGDDVRNALLGAVEQLGPLLDGARGAARAAPSPGRGPDTGTACTDCPVCAVLSTLRGERSELLVRLLDRAADLLDVVRTALHEGGPDPGRRAAPAGPGPAPPAGTDRKVQRIRVERVPSC